MEMKGEHLIAAPRGVVWRALNDTDVLRACIPGCEELTRTSENELHAIAVQKIGPVKAKFEGSVVLSNLNPPTSYTIKGEGKGGVAGFAKGGADVHLSEEPEGTRLSYEVHATVGGKLAQLGSRLINATANKLAAKFFDNLQSHLNGDNQTG